MYELKKLWRGQISPSERFIHTGSQYEQASKTHCEALNVLYTMLSPEARQQYEKLEQLSLDMLSIDTEEAFIQGFRPGVRLILDAITDYRGNFYSLAEKQVIER